MKTLALLSILLILQDPDPAKVDEWVKQLGSDDIAVRDAATRNLVDLGEKVLPLLEKHEKGAAGELKARLESIRSRLTPTSFDALFKFAEEALKPDSKPEAWRPQLTKEVVKFMDILGDSIPARRRDRIRKSVTNSLVPELPIVREASKKYLRTVVVLEKATGEALSREVLLICRTCEVEDLRDSVVICLGDVKTREMNDALVIAKGDIAATREIDPSILLTAGRISTGDVEDSLLLALKGVETGDSVRNVYLNGTKRSTGKTKDDVDVEKKVLPSSK